MIEKTNGYEASERAREIGTAGPIPAPNIGTRISAMAELVGSRQSAADAAGVSVASIQRYVAEDVCPPFDAMAKLARAASVSLDWLATGEGPMRPADVPPPQPMALDAEVLALAIAVLEGVLAECKKEKGEEMHPDHKAEMIQQNYEALMTAPDPEKRKALAESLKAIHRRHLCPPSQDKGPPKITTKGGSRYNW